MVNSTLTQNCDSISGCTTDSNNFPCLQPTTEGEETIMCNVIQDGWYLPTAPPDFYRDMFTAALSSAAKSFTTQQENSVVNRPPRPQSGLRLIRDATKFNTSIVPSSIAALTFQTIDDGNTTMAIGMVRFTIQCSQPASPVCSDFIADAGVAGTLLGLLDPAVIGIAISAAVGGLS